MANKYTFSVIVPVYNAEDYLEQAVTSIVNQTIGFEPNIQLILVNDGSTDGSGALCEQYAAQYPHNVVYVQQEHTGVSAARNKGLALAEGEYINFLDADDSWTITSFEHVINRMAETPDAAVFATRMKYKEAIRRAHPLNYKFNRDENRTVNIFDEAEASSIIFNVGSCFIRRETAQRYRFRENLKIREGASYITELLLDVGEYSTVKSAEYIFRIRNARNSAEQRTVFHKSFYKHVLRDFNWYLIRLSEEKFDAVIPYIKYVLAYDLGRRVSANSKSVNKTLSEEEFNTYIEALRELLQYVDDDIIFTSKAHRSIFVKTTLLSIKYDREVLGDFNYNAEHERLCLGERSVISIPKSKDNCEFYFIDLRGDKLYLEGRVKKWIIDAGCTERFTISIAGEEYPTELSEYRFSNEKNIFGEKQYYYIFKSLVPFKEKFDETGKLSVIPMMHFENGACQVGTSYGSRRYISKRNSEAAYNLLRDEYFFFCDEVGVHFEKPADYQKRLHELETKFQEWLLANDKEDIVKLRQKYFKYKKHNKKPLWIVSDRMDVANDCGEAFFRYLCEKKPKDIQYEFAILKGVKDEKRLKKYGKIVHFETVKFEFHTMIAQAIISSQASEYVQNPLGSKNLFLRNLPKPKFIFLQHGIIKDDCSTWLRKRSKQIDMFVTSAKGEYDSIVNGDYGLRQDEVALTGLSRYDRLYRESGAAKKQILIMPTWRRSIKEAYDANTSSVYFDGFKNTDFFKFYNSLINDERLLAVMREKGYTGVFCLHPIFMKQYIDFEENDCFKVVHKDINYQMLFSESSLMVTDYSSTFFDYCWFKKPVIYSQYDEKEFFKGQIYNKGYFDYERDGFGEVIRDYESCVSKMIEYVQNDCQVEEKYLERIEAFYAFFDDNNCQRIYDRIIETIHK